MRSTAEIVGDRRLSAYKGPRVDPRGHLYAIRRLAENREEVANGDRRLSSPALTRARGARSYASHVDSNQSRESADAESFEKMLTGGHPNSLGRTVEVVDQVLAAPERLAGLYQCYFSSDEVVRLRVSSAMKRVTIAHPDWTMAYMDRLQDQVAAIDQASVQWTLALIFDQTRELLSPRQLERAKAVMKHNLAEHGDWIVLNNCMKVLGSWAEDDPALGAWLEPQARRLASDPRKSVAATARKLQVRLRGRESGAG